MRILQVGIGFTGPEGIAGPVTMGGTAKVMHANSKELVRRGHEVAVWCTNRLDKKSKFGPGTVHHEIDGIDISYLNTHCIPFWPGTFGPSYTPDLARKIRDELSSFDVIHINEARSYMGLAISRAARALGIPYLVQPHGSLYLFYNSRGIKRVYDRLYRGRVLNGAAGVIALQNGERAKCLEIGVPPDKIFVVPNGIDVENIGELPPKGGLRSRLGLTDEPLILFVGRFEKRKGADILVKAFSKSHNQQARLVMIGPDDGTLQEVQDLVVQYGLQDRVFCPGAMVGRDLWSAYVDADLLAFPSRFDISPITLLEGCVAETPMVVTHQCQISDVVGGKAAILSEPEPDEFARAMNAVLDDPALREHLSRGARELCDTAFALPRVVDRLEAVYATVARRNLHA